MSIPLIQRHIEWLRPRTRTANTDEEPPTVVSRRRLLLHARAHLPYGLVRANDLEIDLYLSHWSGWSRYTYDTGMRTFYRWGVRYGHLTLDPMVELPKPEPGGFYADPCTDEELAIALTAPAPYGRAMLMASRAGLRCGEMARAHRDAIRGSILHVHGKGGKVRKVPLDDVLRTELAGETGWLLGREVSASVLTDGQRPVWRRLGLPDTFHLHQGRHWYATALSEAGVPVEVISELLGHASLDMTRRYLRVTAARMAAMVGRLRKVGPAEPSTSRLRGFSAA